METKNIIRLEDGIPVPGDFAQLWEIATVYIRSGLLPAQYDKPEKVIVGMQYAREIGLDDKPLLALRNIAVIKGTPSLWGDLPLVLAHRTKLLEEFTEYILDQKGDPISSANKNLTAEPFGALCIIKRKGNKEASEYVFTRRDAERAGLAGKDVYQKYPQRMYRYRARSAAIKDKVPEALFGMSIAEYDFDILPGSNDRRDKQSDNNLITDDLNQRLAHIVPPAMEEIREPKSNEEGHSDPVAEQSFDLEHTD